MYVCMCVDVESMRACVYVCMYACMYTHLRNMGVTPRHLTPLLQSASFSHTRNSAGAASRKRIGGSPLLHFAVLPYLKVTIPANISLNISIIPANISIIPANISITPASSVK